VSNERIKSESLTIKGKAFSFHSKFYSSTATVEETRGIGTSTHLDKMPLMKFLSTGHKLIFGGPRYLDPVSHLSLIQQRTFLQV
jgi:hypothetical protein